MTSAPPDGAATGAAGSAQRRSVRPSGYWIDDDALLRDEGVLFGFAAQRTGDDPEMLAAKLDAISGHFAPRLDAQRAVHAALAEERDRRRAERDEAEARALAHRAEAARLDTASLDPHDPDSAHQRLRFATSGALAACGAVLTGWIVYDHLVRSGLDHPVLISAGLTLLGFAGPFQPLSVLHVRHDLVQARTDHAEVWKLHVSEWLLPVVAAAFVAVYATPATPPPRALVLALLLAVAFSLVGKLLAGTLTRFAIARRRGREEAARHAEARAAAARATGCANALDGCVKEHEDRLKALHEEMDACESAMADLMGQASYKQKLFLSEYRFGLQVMHSRSAASGDGRAAVPDDLPELVVPDDSLASDL